MSSQAAAKANAVQTPASYPTTEPQTVWLHRGTQRDKCKSFINYYNLINSKERRNHVKTKQVFGISVQGGPWGHVTPFNLSRGGVHAAPPFFLVCIVVSSHCPP